MAETEAGGGGRRLADPGSAAVAAEAVPWQRVHPLTPLVRFWLYAALFLFTTLRQGIEDWLQGHGGESWTSAVPKALAQADPRAWGIGIGVLLLCLAPMTLSWWFHRFRIVEETVQIRQGMLYRRETQARLDRVQSIEITQNALPRLLGLARLAFHVADSGKAVLVLEYLGRKRAEALREDLLLCSHRLKQAAAADGLADGMVDRVAERGPDGAQAGVVVGAAMPSTLVVAVPTGRVLGAVLLETWWILVLAAILVPSMVFSLVLGEPLVTAALGVPVAFAVIGGLWARLNRWGGFRVFSEAPGLRIRYGLASTSQRTIPRGRVQAIGVAQPLLWRLPGWFRVSLTVAGDATGGSGEGPADRVLLPVATGQDLMEVLPHLLESAGSGGPGDPFDLVEPGALGRLGGPRVPCPPGDLAIPRGVDGALVQAALEGSGRGGGFTVSPPRARWLAPLTRRRNGFADAGPCLFLRGGRLTRRLAVLPHGRAQSLAITDGPLRRALGLADVVFHTVPGPVALRVRCLDHPDALRLVAEQAARAAAARRRAGPPGEGPAGIRPPADPRPADHLPDEPRPDEHLSAEHLSTEHAPGGRAP